MKLEIAEFAGTADEWDGFGAVQQGWTHYHGYRWKSVMEGVLGHECRYLAARGDNGLVGILPLVFVRSLAFGRYLVSMPFLNYGGPLGSAEAIRTLTDEARALAAGDRVKLLELRSAIELPVTLPVSHRKITVVLPLPARDPDAAWRALGTKLRAQVKRPEKEGVTVRFGHDQVGAFFDVFSRHMRDLGTPTQPRRLFEAIAETFGEDVWFGAAYLNERPIAAGCGFRWHGEFEMTWASSLTEFNRIAPNMALYWAFIRRAAEEGLTRFNFGRCTPGSGTHRFKRQWGAEDEALWWYQYAPAGRAAATPSPDDGAYAWGPRLWKKLPVPLATMLGPRIVRGIP